jgi:hypothetical protein
MGHPFRPLSLLLHLIRLAAAALAAAVGLPLLLSTAVGARLLAGAAGRVLGARVEVDRVTCVWWQPLRVEGMRVYMPPTGSSWEGVTEQPEQQVQRESGGVDRSGVAGSDAEPSPGPDQRKPADVQQQQQQDDMELLSVERISTAGEGPCLKACLLLVHSRHMVGTQHPSICTQAAAEGWVSGIAIALTHPPKCQPSSRPLCIQRVCPNLPSAVSTTLHAACPRLPPWVHNTMRTFLPSSATLLMLRTLQLLHLPPAAVSSTPTEPLSHLVSGRPFTLTLARPSLTLVWDPDTGAPRLPGSLQLITVPTVTLEPNPSFPFLPQQLAQRAQAHSQQGAEKHGRRGKKAKQSGTTTTTTPTRSSSSSKALKRLQQADGVVALGAELLLPAAQVYVSEGRLACPSELRWVGGG